MFLTPAQHEAIHHHQENLIVVAGAGSGKTFVLVERYLALLDAHPDRQLNALVAITFTQKAAQEMRDRVRQHLQAQADSALDAQAAARWAGRLAAMDSARIMTIDGLFASILRANAAEAGVDPGFTVLDEIESSVLLNDALDDALRTLAADDPTLELFAEYGERTVRAELKALVNVEFDHLLPDLFTLWLAQWVEAAHAQINRFLRWCAGSELVHWTAGFPEGDRLAEIANVYATALTEIEQHPILADRLNILYEIKSIKLLGGSVRLWGDAELLAQVRVALKAFKAQVEACLDQIGDPPGIPDQRAAHLLPLWIALAQRVRDVYRAAKDERSALDFADLERLTSHLLENDDVSQRYFGGEFRHILVDEFQDTNAGQWSIIRRLADPAQPGCLFVVGDPKQSIYGFRGADVSVFEQVRDVIAASRSPIDLSTSFRTHQRLVACFNGLFERLLVRDSQSAVHAYEVEFGVGMQAHRAEPPSDAPALELMLFDRERQNDLQDEEMSGRAWEAAVVAQRIRELVEEQRPVFDKRSQFIRPAGYGDVALLFQAMTNVTLYEAALKREGIPYLTVAGKGYYDRQEVWDLLNLLRALDNPADDLALASALRSPLFSLSDDALLALRPSLQGDQPREQSRALWKVFAQPIYLPQDEIEVVEFAHHTLTDLRSMAGRVTIAELLREALERTGYLAVLTGLPDGKRRRGNVEKLLEKAETSGRITLSAFTQYIRDMRDNEAREGEADLESEGAVQLMTVHKSKGLEFPVVYLVDSSYERRGGAGAVVSGLACKVYDAGENKLVSTFAHRQAEHLASLRETAERRRLLYVAATRAQDYLIVSGQVACRQDKPLAAKGWLGWLVEALDLYDIPPTTALIAQPWGNLLVTFPEPVAAEYIPEHFTPWSDVAPSAEPPLLLEPVPRSIVAPTRSLTGAQIADLGSALYAESPETQAFFAERWQRGVFHNAPSRIDPVRLETAQRVGEIVHRAIRWELPERDDDLRELLRRYAWEEGIVEGVENQDAVAGAYELLQRVRGSDVFRWGQAAHAVYREVPFTYRTEHRTIHGVIDLLMQDTDGNWRLIDYKTGWLGEWATDESLALNARRYHLQMAVYAAAVQELVGMPPLVYIHYIRYAQTVMIHEAEWRDALVILDRVIEDVVEHG